MHFSILLLLFNFLGAFMVEADAVASIYRSRVEALGTYSLPTLNGEEVFSATEIDACVFRFHRYYSKNCELIGKTKETHLMIDLSTVESIRAEDVGGRFIVYFDPKAKGSEVGIGFPIKFFSGGLYCDGSTIPPDDFPPSIPIPKESGELFRDNLEMYIDAQCQPTK